VIQHINRSKDKNHIIFFIDPQKAFDEIQQHPFLIKALKKLEIEITNVPQHNKGYTRAVYIANIMLNREKVKPFLLKE
jgi:N-dimethylarginine dimethylaminohydrolase